MDDGMRLEQVKVGMKFQLHPATDVFMMGFRTGVVTKVGRKWVHAEIRRLDTVRKVQILPENMQPVKER